MTYSQRSIDYPQYGRGGGVARNNDNANALSMLHSSLIDTRNELRSSLTEGFDRLQSAGDGAHRETQDLITTELSKLRTQLRETINRLLTSNTDFAHESRDILALLRSEPSAQAAFDRARASGDPDWLNLYVKEATRHG